MDEFKVLITTSGLGSRLGSLTDYTNKSLVRIGNKPAISYIIESYPDTTNFVVTLGHFGSHVKQFLTLSYPTHNFTFVNIDKYKGEGSSLGYSILQCKDVLQCPFIFHASDTLIQNYTPIQPSQNYVVGTYKKDSSQYRTFNINSDRLHRINEKGELHYDLTYIGVCGIKDYDLFFNELQNLVNENYQDISDLNVIDRMLSATTFNHVNPGADKWYDIGNTAELAKTRKSYKGSIEVLDKKDESIFFFDNFVIKFFSDTTINQNRVTRAYNLKGLVPEILGATENFYKYKKAEGNLFSKSVNRKKFLKFLEWTQNNLWIPTQDENFKNKCYDFYVVKTKKRIDQYLKENTESNIINGEYIPSIYKLLDSIDTDWLCDGIPSQFHGDFILDNIIETSNGFCLIDWRQDFAGDLKVGDVYYDLSKLNHNMVINHDIVNQNLFNSSPDDCYILVSSKLNECKGVLHSFIKEKGYDLKKVKMLTALIWINMAPLHEYPFNKFLFNFGKYNLYKILNNEF